MRNIWKDGFEIERDGQKIVITPKEIGEINFLIEALNGRGSVEYFIDYCDYDIEDEELTRLAKFGNALLEDEQACYEIWNDYWENISYDTGDMEREAVEGYLIGHFGRED